MKVKDLLETLEGTANIELHIDGLELHFTPQNAKPEWLDREIEKVKLDPQIYLGIKIFLV